MKPGTFPSILLALAITLLPIKPSLSALPELGVVPQGLSLVCKREDVIKGLFDLDVEKGREALKAAFPYLNSAGECRVVKGGEVVEVKENWRVWEDDKGYHYNVHIIVLRDGNDDSIWYTNHIEKVGQA